MLNMKGSYHVVEQPTTGQYYDRSLALRFAAVVERSSSAHSLIATATAAKGLSVETRILICERALLM